MFWIWAKEAADTEVSWQSAFWALVPLALSAMTQPSGQVLQYPLQLRTYLRSSPVVCGFDALTQLIRLAAYLLTGCCPTPVHAAARSMQIRTQHQRQSGPVEGFQALETLTTVRWLVFAFGTIPQAVKVMAFRGLYWTKAWGGLYLASFVVMESFIIFGKRTSYELLNDDEQDHLDGSTTIRRRGTWTTSALEQLDANLARFEAFCGYLALILQLSYLGWVFYVLLYPLIDFSGKFGDGEKTGYAITVVVWIPIIYFAVFIYLGLAWICLALPSHRRGCLPILLSIIAGISCLTAYPVALVVLFTLCEQERVIELLTGVFLTILAYLASLILLWIIGEFLALESFLRYKVLLVNRERTKREEDKNWAIAAWSIFAGTLTLAVCYYAFRYDPTGTYKPRWTEAIG